MLRIVVAAALAFSFASLDAADAAGKHKRQKVRAHLPAVTAPMKPAVTRPPGPSWAGPNDCYTDEGYGRYLPCGGGMDM
jgi:hypothetical protein